MLPTESMAMLLTESIDVAVALPPSTGVDSQSDFPVPATVVIMPVLASTFRTRLFDESAMYMFPDASNATFSGELSLAAVARMLSPL